MADLEPDQNVNIANWGDTPPISGEVEVTNFPLIQAINIAQQAVTLAVTPTDSAAVLAALAAIDAAVVANASVTVANVVTIVGSVTVNNPTASSVTVTNFPVTQNVSGSVTVNNPTTSVTVSNFPATQPVSGSVTINNPVSAVTVSSLPAITGAVTVNNPQTSVTISNGAALAALTQVVSGMVTVNNPVSTVTVSNLPITQSIFGFVTVNNFPVTQHIDGGVSIIGAPPVVISSGTTGAFGDIAQGDAGNNALVIGSGIISTNFSSATTVALDLAHYRYVAVTLAAGSTGISNFQQSDDNVTWRNCPYANSQIPNSVTTAGPITNSPASYIMLPSLRFFRVLYTSGTVTGTVLQSSTPMSFQNQLTVSANGGTVNAAQSGTWTVAQGGAGTTPWQVGGKAPIASFTAKTTTGAGTALDTTQSMAHANMVINITGTVTLATVILEGSLDGVTWITLGTTSITTGSVSVSPTGLVPYRQFRANVTVITPGAGSITAWVAAA